MEFTSEGDYMKRVTKIVLFLILCLGLGCMSQVKEVKAESYGDSTKPTIRIQLYGKGISVGGSLGGDSFYGCNYYWPGEYKIVGANTNAFATWALLSLQNMPDGESVDKYYYCLKDERYSSEEKVKEGISDSEWVETSVSNKQALVTFGTEYDNQEYFLYVKGVTNKGNTYYTNTYQFKFDFKIPELYRCGEKVNILSSYKSTNYSYGSTTFEVREKILDMY